MIFGSLKNWVILLYIPRYPSHIFFNLCISLVSLICYTYTSFISFVSFPFFPIFSIYLYLLPIYIAPGMVMLSFF